MTITEDELVEDLQRVGDELGRAPKYEEYRELGQFHPSTPEKKFGSWNEAVTEAGFEPNRHTDITREDVLEDIDRITEKLGRRPKISELTEHGKYAEEVYVKHDWKDAFQPSREEIIESIQELGEQLDKRPTREDYRQKGRYRIADIKREFEYWNTAVQEAGYTAKHGRPRDG